MKQFQYRYQTTTVKQNDTPFSLSKCNEKHTRIPAPRLLYKQQLNISVLLAGNWSYFLIRFLGLEAEMYKRKDLMMVLGMDVMTCTIPNTEERARRFGGGSRKHTDFSHVRVASSCESMLKCIKDRKRSTSLMEMLLRPNASVLC